MRHFDVFDIQHNKKNSLWKTKSNQIEIFFSSSFYSHSCTWNEIFTKTKTPSVAQITLIKQSRYVNCLFATELSLFNHIFGEIFKLKSYSIVETGQHSYRTVEDILEDKRRIEVPHPFQYIYGCRLYSVYGIFFKECWHFADINFVIYFIICSFFTLFQ